MNYQIVQSIEGVVDYYTTLSWVLRKGKLSQVRVLSEIEMVRFGGGLGGLEAFTTAGALSRMSFRYEDKIPTMEYRTLRYPGHATLMEGIRALGLLDLDAIDVKGTRVVPRDAFIAAAAPKLTKEHSKDLVALRVLVEGNKGGKPKRLEWELVDKDDGKHGISAMMRTTGYSLSITGLMQARGQVKPAGVHTPDECGPAGQYIAELKKRGVEISQVP